MTNELKKVIRKAIKENGNWTGTINGHAVLLELDDFERTVNIWVDNEESEPAYGFANLFMDLDDLTK